MAPAPAPPPSSWPGITDLTLVEFLGRGGSATVFRASGPASGDDLAVKIAHAPDDWRVNRDAEVLQCLATAPVPAIAPGFYRRGRTLDGRPYVAMEYFRESLTDRMDAMQRRAGRTGAVDLARIARTLRAVCEAVSALHRAGFVHRDLKPENLMFRGSDRAVLIDYGLCRPIEIPAGAWPVRVEHRVTARDERAGTHYYMAPEQWTGAPTLDRRTDVYALGVIAFEMLTGKLPFVGDAAAIGREHQWAYRPWPSIHKPLPAGIDAAVRRCLHKRPADRHASALELADEFERYIGEPARHSHLATVEPTGRQRRPVGALLFECAAGTAAVSRFAHERGAVVVHERAPRFLLGFTGEPSLARAARTTLASARRALDTGIAGIASSAVLVDVLECAVRRRGRSAMPVGRPIRAVMHLDLPARRDSIVLTDNARRHLGHLSTEPCATGGHQLLASSLAAEESVDPGRNIDPAGLSVLGPMVAHADRAISAIVDCLRRGVPEMHFLEAKAGLGKTRFLRLLTDGCAALPDPDLAGRLQVLSLRARAPDGRDPHPLAVELFEHTLGAGLRTEADLDAAWQRLGGAPDNARRRSSALILGIAHPASDQDPAGPLGHHWRPATSALALALECAARRRPLAVLIDDAQQADHIALSALESATLPEVAVPLFVVVAGRPPFVEGRRRFSDRAREIPCEPLPALPVEAGRTLMRTLLAPAESIPDRLLDHLHERAGGVPGQIIALCQHVRAAGAIQPDPQGDGGFILSPHIVARAATDDRDRQLAGQTLEGLPASWSLFLHLCAILGEPIDAGIALAVQDRLFTEARVTSRVDAVAGLAYLASAGVLAERDGGYHFRPPQLGPAIAALVPDDRRRLLHRAIYEHLATTEPPDSLTCARHAAGSGAHPAAARLFATAAARALAQHRDVDAENLCSRALEQVAEARAAELDDGLGDGLDDIEREAFTHRGRVRYRLKQQNAAVADFRAARALIPNPDNDERTIQLLLEESKALDWAERWGEAAEHAERAGELAAGRTISEELAAALALAHGRSLYRAQRYREALPVIEPLGHARDRETRIIALLLLGPMWVYHGDHERAARAFDQVISLCREVGDEFHLTAAYINRQQVWLATGDIERTREDMETAIRLSRQLGNAQLERYATFNLAEMLYWGAEFARAVTLAERARDLYLRFLSQYEDPDDHLLLARIHCACGRADEARAALTWIADHCGRDDLMPVTRALLRMAHLAVQTLADKVVSTDAWQALAERALAEYGLDEEHIETLTVGAEVALVVGNPAAAGILLQAAGDSPRLRERHQQIRKRIRRRTMSDDA